MAAALRAAAVSGVHRRPFSPYAPGRPRARDRRPRRGARVRLHRRRPRRRASGPRRRGSADCDRCIRALGHPRAHDACGRAGLAAHSRAVGAARAVREDAARRLRPRRRHEGAGHERSGASRRAVSLRARTGCARAVRHDPLAAAPRRLATGGRQRSRRRALAVAGAAPACPPARTARAPAPGQPLVPRHPRLRRPLRSRRPREADGRARVPQPPHLGARRARRARPPRRPHRPHRGREDDPVAARAPLRLRDPLPREAAAARHVHRRSGGNSRLR
jgi:hypothetical protein